MHQFVRPDAVLKAVDWLVENNQLYCGMNVDHQWNESCMYEDSETWSGKTPVSRRPPVTALPCCLTSDMLQPLSDVTYVRDVCSGQ